MLSQSREESTTEGEKMDVETPPALHGRTRPGIAPAQHRRGPETKWRQTITALLQTYYAEGLDELDERYALAGLQRYEHAWAERHGARAVSTLALDEAAANEVWYQWSRGRQFRRAIAALSACWTGLVTERPERITDRQARIDRARERSKQSGRPIGAAGRPVAS